MESMLFKIVKARKRPVGCVIAKLIGDDVYITGSLCHRKLDKFCKHRAIDLAESRAMAMHADSRACSVPASLKYDMECMIDRAHRYFAGAEVFSAPVKAMPPPFQILE